MGVYKIWNEYSGNYYIGKSDISIRSRLLSHLHRMKTGELSNTLWRIDLKEYGIDSFRCEVVEYTVGSKETRALENRLIASAPTSRSYNIAGPRDGFDGERILIAFGDVLAVRGLSGFGYNIDEIRSLTPFDPTTISAILGNGPTNFSIADAPNQVELKSADKLRIAMRHKKSGWDSWVGKTKQMESWLFRFLCDAGAKRELILLRLGSDASEFKNDHRWGQYRPFDLEEFPNFWLSNQIYSFRMLLGDWLRDEPRAELYKRIIKPDGPLYLQIFELTEEFLSEAVWGSQYRYGLTMNAGHAPSKPSKGVALAGPNPDQSLVRTMKEVRRVEKLAQRENTNFFCAWKDYGKL